MSGTFILVELAGYVGCLSWGTHRVTRRVQCGLGSELRHWLGRNLRGRARIPRRIQHDHVASEQHRHDIHDELFYGCGLDFQPIEFAG